MLADVRARRTVIEHGCSIGASVTARVTLSFVRPPRVFSSRLRRLRSNGQRTDALNGSVRDVRAPDRA
jgi:hypothetical protein